MQFETIWQKYIWIAILNSSIIGIYSRVIYYNGASFLE